VSVPPETRYARNGAIHLAYQVLGTGPPNLLVVQSGPNSHVDCNWMAPSLALGRSSRSSADSLPYGIGRRSAVLVPLHRTAGAAGRLPQPRMKLGNLAG
jgi:hypothetical protein